MSSGLSRVRFMLKASLKRYFLTGLLVITPIWGTILILKTLFVTVDGILGDLLAQLVPDHYVPGLGIVTLILLVFITGLLAANFIGKQIVKLWEAWLNRVPLVRGIYSTLKSMMDILSFSEQRLVPPRGADPISEKRALLFCLCDGRHEGRYAGFGPGTACACVCADLAESDLRVFSSRSRARGDGD